MPRGEGILSSCDRQRKARRMARLRAARPETREHEVSVEVPWDDLRTDEEGTKAWLDEYRRARGVPDDIVPGCSTKRQLGVPGGFYVYTWVWREPVPQYDHRTAYLESVR